MIVVRNYNDSLKAVIPCPGISSAIFNQQKIEDSGATL